MEKSLNLTEGAHI